MRRPPDEIIRQGASGVETVLVVFGPLGPEGDRLVNVDAVHIMGPGVVVQESLLLSDDGHRKPQLGGLPELRQPEGGLKFIFQLL